MNGGGVEVIDRLKAIAPCTLSGSKVSAQNGHQLGVRPRSREYEVQARVARGTQLRSRGEVVRGEINTRCPLRKAVLKCIIGVVQFTINEGRTGAVRVQMALSYAPYASHRSRQAITLRPLLVVYGEERRPGWANTWILGGRVVLVGDGLYSAVRTILKAGANDSAWDAETRLCIDLIGLEVGPKEEV